MNAQPHTTPSSGPAGTHLRVVDLRGRHLGWDELRRVVFEADLSALTLVPGVGRKTAARLLLELKSRLDVPDGIDGETVFSSGSARAEVREALAALGYQPEEVRRAMVELPAEGDVGTLVRNALQALGASR